jgi:hypothetical protein
MAISMKFSVNTGSGHININFYWFRNFSLLQLLITFSLKHNILPLSVGYIKGLLTDPSRKEQRWCDLMGKNCVCIGIKRFIGVRFNLLPGFSILQSKYHLQSRLKYSAEDRV